MAGVVYRRSIGAVMVVGIAAVTFAQSASAGDGDFFSSLFGGAPQSAPAVQMPDAGGFDNPVPQIRRRPLTVKLRRPKVAYAKPDGKPVKVSIYEDRTLRRGDAVMTQKGIRIFAGSSSWPYQQSDFVAIASAGKMNGAYQKALLDMDRGPSR